VWGEEMSMSPRLLRPRATGFNPKSLAGLAGWWDFNDATTVTIETGIRAVTDKSGNGRTLNQTTTNNQPAWVPNSINGKYAAVFDGSNDNLNASFTLTQPCHYFIVFKFNNVYSSGVQTVLDGVGVSALLYRGESTRLRFYAGPSFSDANILKASVTESEVTTFGIWDIPLNGNPSFLRRNGAEKTAAIDRNTGTNSPGGINLGTFNNGFSNPGDVSVAEVLMYSRVLSSSEERSVRSYLGGKFALSVA
jgi:hypothetical protein